MSDEAAVNHSEIKDALGSIGLSTILILGATFLSQGMGFVTRITMARYLPVNGYGSVVLGISLLNLLGIFALSGLPQALSRYIPRKDTDAKRRRVVASAFHVVFVLSIVLAAGTFLLAEPVSRVVFDNPDLVWVFRVFALALPCYALFKLSIGGFRGYERTKPQVITDKVLLPGLQLVGIVAFVTFGYDTAGIAFAYAVAFALVAVVSVGVVYRLGKFSVRDVVDGGSTGQYRELLEFSVPLAASGAINTIAKHSDLVILGAFLSSSAVGLYEVSFRMSMFVVFLISPAVGYLFQPLISKYDAEADHQRMEKLFTVTTRWITVGTFPVFVLMFLFPEQTLVFFFSDEYTTGSLALRFLVLGSMITRIPGLTGAFLTAVGKTKTLMYISVATAILNIAVNIVLIPTYGILGAAIATAGARVFNNLVQSIVILRLFQLSPFNWEYLFPLSVISAVVTAIFVSPLPLQSIDFIGGILVAGGIGVVYLLLIIATKSVYTVEVELLERLLEKAGISIPVSKVLQPFIR